jgi:RimJ/RimL family protein N-acetyltransferase
MASIILRPFASKDPEYLARWYEEDRPGLEELMGIDLPDHVSCTLAFNNLLEGDRQGYSLFLMAEHGDHPIGLVLVTDITPDTGSGRPHWYIAPDERRHSLSVAREAHREARRRGFRYFLASIPDQNKPALAVAKRLGYAVLPRVMMFKELEPWEQNQHTYRSSQQD